MKITPEHRNEVGSRSRRNGLECPLDPKQVAQWFVLTLFTLYDAIVVIPALRILPLNLTILIVLFLSNIIAQFLASYVDPKEHNVEYGEQERTVFRRSAQNPHVIRNLYCNICKVSVQKQTKHCKACNKCVEVFDHHCDWLNNCIGFHNYRYFFAAVVTAILLCIFVLATCLCQIIALNGHERILAPGYFIDAVENKIALTVTAAFVSALVGLILIFLVQLLLLHISLIHRSMTTYEYIISKRDKQRAKEKAAELELANQKRENDESGRQNESFHHEHVNTVSERVKSASGTVVTVTDVNLPSTESES